MGDRIGSRHSGSAKGFVVDDYMIVQAAAYGAAAVLLICALLDDRQLREYREMAEDLGMDALVEAHDAEEVERALKSGARIIGVNNRDLKTFEVDMENSIQDFVNLPRTM